MTEVEIIAEALAKHQHGASVPASLRAECDKHLACTCGEWVSSQCKTMTARDEHRLHQASVVAALPDIAIATIPKAMNVRWEPIPGFDRYMASERGEIFSIINDCILEPRIDQNGYEMVSLFSAGPQRNIRVHRLICKTFNGPPPKGRNHVRHLDGVKTHNTPDNLKWGNNSENVLDTVIHGNHFHARKTHCPQGHEYNAENTQLYNGKRTCRTCHAERDKARRLARKSAGGES